MMSRYATFARSLAKTAVLLGSITLAATPVTPALAATTDPFQVLYIFPGVLNAGGVATVVHCFSFSPTAETIQYTVRNSNGTIAANTTIIINQFQTKTATTQAVVLYFSDLSFGTGIVNQGALGISATSPNIVCTAQVIDASVSVPNGIDLHPTRFNPISGSQE